MTERLAFSATFSELKTLTLEHKLPEGTYENFVYFSRLLIEPDNEDDGQES